MSKIVGLVSIADDISVSNGSVSLATSELILPKLASDPANPVEGQLYYNTTDKSLKLNVESSFRKVFSPKDGSSAVLALEYGSDVIDLIGSSFTPGLYWLTGKKSSGFAAQQVYVEADGFMLFYRHAGTGGSYNATYEIIGDNLGEAAVGTLYSPTQGLTDTGSSTTAGSRGMARLATDFVRALGGESASGNVIRMTCGGTTAYITDAQWYATAGTGGSDTYGHDTSISYGSTYAGRRTYTGYNTGQTSRPLGTYPGNILTIPYYQGNNYSGGYNGSWHVDTTIWIRQY